MPIQANMLVLHSRVTSSPRETYDFCSKSLASDMKWQCVPLLFTTRTIYFSYDFVNMQPAVSDCLNREMGQDDLQRYQSQQFCDSLVLYPQTFLQKNDWELSLCFHMKMVGGTIFRNMIVSLARSISVLQSWRSQLSKLWLSLTSTDVKSLAIGVPNLSA